MDVTYKCLHQYERPAFSWEARILAEAASRLAEYACCGTIRRPFDRVALARTGAGAGHRPRERQRGEAPAPGRRRRGPRSAPGGYAGPGWQGPRERDGAWPVWPCLGGGRPGGRNGREGNDRGQLIDHAGGWPPAFLAGGGLHRTVGDPSAETRVRSGSLSLAEARFQCPLVCLESLATKSSARSKTGEFWEPEADVPAWPPGDLNAPAGAAPYFSCQSRALYWGSVAVK
jgi:hypothetical protein